jgi:subtilisin-like proprotein convertase family protein
MDGRSHIWSGKARNKGLCLVVVGTMLSTLPVPVVQAADKETTYSEMQALGAQIESLKGQPGSELTCDALASRYRALSAQLGGDDPANVGGGAGDGAARASQGPQRGSNPPGCGGVTNGFTQSTPVPIPDLGVVTSTLNVAGLTGFIIDVDLTTFITHTFPGDLDMTLTSPAGTIVTFSSDNAGTNENVFNGTVWDDDANPGGQVPYVTNAGLATDHPYSNLTLASPLAPEEALSAFLGENPNGTWTITISDDAGADVGTLNSWSLNINTITNVFPSVTPVFTQNTPVVIPAGPGVVSSTLNVPATGSIFDLVVRTNITHTFNSDLDITLQSPSGTVVTLTSDNGGGNDNVFDGTLWSDNANPGGQVPYANNNGLVNDHLYVNLTPVASLVPEEALGAFRGESVTGTWTLTISDDAGPDGGNLASWTLQFLTGTCFIRGDFNTDGRTDILWRHETSGENVLWYMNGTVLAGGEFTTPPALVDTRWKMVGTNDFNADAKNDILWRHDTSGENVLWFMNGAVLTSGTFLTPASLADTNWKMAGTGDFDQDSRPDIAWHHQAVGQIVLWYMNGSSLVTGTFTTPSTMDLSYRLVGVADFSEPQDNLPDFVWRNPTTGDNLIWLMNNANQISSVTTMTLTDSRWELVATGDYNQDQKNDFVWRHQTSGENVVWFMNGPTFVGGTFTTPASFPDVRWKMVGPR